MWEKAERTFAIESLLEFDSPLSLGLLHLEHRNADEKDEERSNERKDSLPQLFRLLPKV